MMRKMLLSALLASGLFAPGPAAFAQTSDEARRLHAFFDAEWERRLEESPMAATYAGDNRANDRWDDMSLAAIEARGAADRKALAELLAMDRGKLSAADQLSYDIKRWQLENGIEAQKFRRHLIPLSQRGGVQSANETAEVIRFATTRDYRDWLARMRALPALIDQNTALMREGIKAGVMPPKVLMQRISAQIDKQLVDDPTKSPFYATFERFPDAIPAAERTALAAEARKVIAGDIVPAYRKFATFFNDEYLPKARNSIAASDGPDGQAYYAYTAKMHTTTDLTPQQIHDIGLKEVARIRAEMLKIKDEVGFKGDLKAFFMDLRSNPRFFYKTPEELFTAYQAISKRIDPELVKVSKMIPRMPYGVRPIPMTTAADNTTAYYMGPAQDGSRPGYYYVNLYRPEVRPKWEMMALSLHEAVPGHHFQIARAQELGELPKFRRHGGFTAYIEGWGLYAERLGFDMGLYDDPYDRMGQLAYDMWRAVRLVVDTGMHAKGWSREQAIGYFMDNSPKTEADITNEIDRYISWPGQALAYKIGQLKSSELRARAERELGPKFDIREFNDAVLDIGAVPLTVLEARMDAWIAARKRA